MKKIPTGLTVALSVLVFIMVVLIAYITVFMVPCRSFIPDFKVAGEASEPCYYNEAEPTHSDWQNIQTKEFSIALPPGWSFEELQGIDSYVGKFVSNGTEVMFDYGWYSGDPSQGDDDYIVFEQKVDGYNARFFTSEKNSDAGIFFGNLGGGDFGSDRLSLYVTGLTPEEQVLMLEIFKTIKFSKADTHQGSVNNEAKTYFFSQEECEQVTKQECVFSQCDFAPEGKTIEEVCGPGPTKGWEPSKKIIK